MSRIPAFALWYRAVMTACMLVVVACSAGDTPEPSFATWITESEYQFNGAPEADVILQRPVIRADPPRDRLLVLDPPSSQVSAWTPGGSLGFVVGRRGEGPGDFAAPQNLFVEGDGSFSVLGGNGSRFTYFTVEGELEGSVRGPSTSIGYQGFAIRLAWPRNGVHLGVPRLLLDYELGLMGDDPFDSQPLLRVRTLGDGRWGEPEPLLWLDVRNRALLLQDGDGRRSFSMQPFGDADQVRFEPGTAVVMRTKGTPGVVELIEVGADGDTAWHRRLQFEPHRLTAQLLAETRNKFVEAAADYFVNVTSVSRQRLGDMYSEALYSPEYLPAADGLPVLAASGEVWIRTHEVVDTLRTHYAVRRGDMNEEPRRVLLPLWLRVSDATDTHVWGTWRDLMDVPHVVGRRLVALEASD